LQKRIKCKTNKHSIIILTAFACLDDYITGGTWQHQLHCFDLKAFWPQYPGATLVYVSNVMSIPLDIFTNHCNFATSSTDLYLKNVPIFTNSSPTHADRQGVDISFTVCLFFVILCVCVCVCVCTLRISQPKIKLAASNFAVRYIGIPGRESPILGNFAPPEAQNQTNRPVRKGQWMFQLVTAQHDMYAGSACVDIWPSPKMDVLVHFWPT